MDKIILPTFTIMKNNRKTLVTFRKHRKIRKTVPLRPIETRLTFKMQKIKEQKQRIQQKQQKVNKVETTLGLYQQLRDDFQDSIVKDHTFQQISQMFFDDSKSLQSYFDFKSHKHFNEDLIEQL